MLLLIKIAELIYYENHKALTYNKYSKTNCQSGNFTDPNLISSPSNLIAPFFFAVINKIVAFVHVFVVADDKAFVCLLPYVFLNP